MKFYNTLSSKFGTGQRKTQRLKLLLFALVPLLLFLIPLPLLLAWSHTDQIVNVADVSMARPVAIVFGAGILNKTTPSDVLRDRLKVAAELYHAKKIERILVSGDNSRPGYSEPDVMREVLVDDYGVSAEAIFADYAGRRTFDTCIRAREVWGIEHAVLVSQAYHLPRAIWTCEHLGIANVGVSASLQPYVFDVTYRQRERLALYKAFLDLYLFAPDYVKGEFIQDLDW